MTNAKSKAITDPARTSARRALTRLRDGGLLVVESSGERTRLPDPVAAQVVELLQAYVAGQAPQVLASTDEVSTQEAATILGLSRPTVVKMINQGRIPCSKPGSHRRIRRDDLMTFKAALDRQRSDALDALAKLSQQMREEDIAAGRFDDDMI